jgi:uncharacterized membrane protein
MVAVLLARIGPEELFQLWKFLVSNYPQGFIAAGLVTVVAFVGLILVPAVDSYGRAWEKVAAGFMSLFVLTTMVAIGSVLGLLVFYHSTDLVNAVP